MKKFNILLALVCALLLTSCAPAESGSASSAGSSQPPAQSVEADKSVEEPWAPDPASVVEAKVEMQPGDYDDEITYGCRPEFIQGDQYVQPDYYGVRVENITPTTFDVTLLFDTGEEEKVPEEVFRGTACFVEDGLTAVWKDLTFRFPDEWNGLPIVVDFRLEGFEPAAEVLFVNNDIPGFEFS